MKSAKGRLSETSPAAADTDETENSVSSPLFVGWSSVLLSELFQRLCDGAYKKIRPMT